MTEFYDVERTLTSLGIGEAVVTVLSPRGAPTPLAATRLLAPDSLMSPLDEVQFRGRIAVSQIAAKYGQAIDRDSAYERISARLAAGREAAAAAVGAGGGPAVDPTLTPAQQQREIARRARELAAAQRAADRAAARERQAIERERKAAEREFRRQQAAREREERARQRTLETAIRTGGRVASSRLGQDLIRGVFGTIFGGGRRR
jgi:hypothetical protein